MSTELIDARRAFLLLALGAIIFGVIVAYIALSNETTGTATVSVPTFTGEKRESVTRQSSPIQFRHATNLRWGISIISFTVGVVSFTLYRKLDDCG